MVADVDFLIAILVRRQRQRIDPAGLQADQLEVVVVHLDIDTQRREQTTQGFIGAETRRHGIVTGLAVLVARAVEFVLGIQQVDQVALANEEFLAIGTHGLARLLHVLLEKGQLPVQRIVRHPRQAQGFDDLAAHAGGELLLLVDRTGLLAALGLVGAAVVEVVAQVEHQAGFVGIARCATDIVAPQLGKTQIHGRIATAARALVIGTRGFDIAEGHLHGRMLLQGLVDQRIQIVRRQLGQQRVFQLVGRDIAAEQLVKLGQGILQVVLLRDQTGVSTGHATFGLLQLRYPSDTGIIPFANLRQDAFMGIHILHRQLVQLALLEHLEIGLDHVQGHIVGAVVKVEQGGAGTGAGLFDLVGGVVAVEQVLGQRQLHSRTVVIHRRVAGSRGVGTVGAGGSLQVDARTPAALGDGLVLQDLAVHMQLFLHHRMRANGILYGLRQVQRPGRARKGQSRQGEKQSQSWAESFVHRLFPVVSG